MKKLLWLMFPIVILITSHIVSIVYALLGGEMPGSEKILGIAILMTLGYIIMFVKEGKQ